MRWDARRVNRSFKSVWNIAIERNFWIVGFFEGELYRKRISTQTHNCKCMKMQQNRLFHVCFMMLDIWMIQFAVLMAIKHNQHNDVMKIPQNLAEWARWLKGTACMKTIFIFSCYWQFHATSKDFSHFALLGYVKVFWSIQQKS